MTRKRHIQTVLVLLACALWTNWQTQPQGPTFTRNGVAQGMTVDEVEARLGEPDLEYIGMQQYAVSSGEIVVYYDGAERVRLVKAIGSQAN